MRDVPGAAGGRLPKLLVLYATGAAAPTDIVAAAADLADVTFACAATDPEVRAIGRLLSTVAGCVWYATPQELAETTVGFDAVVTFAESKLPDLAVAVEAGNLPGPDRDVVRRLIHKPTQRAAMAAAGLPVPRWRIAGSRAEILDAWASLDRVPCIVKPAVGMGSLNTFALDPDVDVAALPVPPGEFIVEERLLGRPMPHRRAGDYCSVETASSRGKHEAVAVVARMPLMPPFRETGVFIPPALDDRERDEVVRAALDALTACEMSDGVSHTEIKLTADGPRVIEVNGRLGGHMAHLVGEATGRDLVRDAILCALGEAPASGAPHSGAAGTVFRKWFYAKQIEGTVSAVHGLDAIRAFPAVMGVKRLLRPGDDISWTLGTASSVVQVDGRAADLDEVDRVLDEAEEQLEISISPPGPSTRAAS